MWELIGKLFVGFLSARIGWSFLKGIFGCYLGNALGFSVNFKKMGSWAVVTGSTDGIGKAYAFEMARRGLNVVLISRTPYKLQNVAAEIHSKYGVSTKIIDVDFTKSDIYDRIGSDLKGLEIGVLINNVGMSYDHPETFAKWDNCMEQCEQIINCNILSVTQMTALVLPEMITRRTGVIINISSFSAVIPAPLLAVYAATKNYVTTFSKNLTIETSGTGVIIQCISPAFVATKLSKIRRVSLLVPNPENFVRSSLNTTGIESCTAGYFSHKIQTYFAEIALMLFPEGLLSSISYSQLNAIRRKALKKKEGEEKQE